MEFKLSDLITAEVVPRNTLPKTAESKRTLNKVKSEARNRLIAQEYVRNGMNFANAYKTVTGAKSMSTTSVHKILGKGADVFMDEVSRIVGQSDIDRDRALNILWSIINMSILDFMDDNGQWLSPAELKKLPRIMQIMISKVEIVTTEAPIKTAKGDFYVDDNGKPYLTQKHRVKIEVPEKMAALNQLAQIMRWVGPATQVNLNVNIGRAMADADARAEQVGMIYEGVAKRLD